MKNKSLQELVDLYCKHRAEGLRNLIISKAMPLVRSIIGKINRPDQPLSQREDLESAAIIGLIQAMDSYDCDRDIQFNTFAYYRVRGNIIDYLRRIDQLPRKQRKNYGKIQEIIDVKSQFLGRAPTDEEIATELDMDIGDYHQLLSNVQQRNALSLDRSFSDNDSSSFYDIHADPNADTPDTNLERKEKASILQQKIGELGDRDRLILTLYYYEDMTMSEIALLLELTEARISQIVGKLLLKLKRELSKEEILEL